MPRIILTPILVLAWVGAIISEPEGGTLLPVILVPGAIRRVDFYPAHGIFNVTLRSGQVLGILADGETYKLITPFSEKEWSQNTRSLGEMALAMRMTKKASQTASGQPG